MASLCLSEGRVAMVLACLGDTVQVGSEPRAFLSWPKHCLLFLMFTPITEQSLETISVPAFYCYMLFLLLLNANVAIYFFPFCSGLIWLTWIFQCMWYLMDMVGIILPNFYK